MTEESKTVSIGVTSKGSFIELLQSLPANFLVGLPDDLIQAFRALLEQPQQLCTIQALPAAAGKLDILLEPTQRFLDLVEAARTFKRQQGIVENSLHENSPSVAVNASTVAGRPGVEESPDAPVPRSFPGEAGDE